MGSNNDYKRYFIILQEDDKGYEMSPGKIPTGYVKIEVKNSKVRLNAFIQNVRMEDRIEYRLILVAAGRKLAVDVGKIIIDGSGRGELSYELESDNVLKSGLGIGEFSVAAVTAGATVTLSGYIGRDKLDWKGKYEIVNRQKAQAAPRIDKKIEIEEIVPEIPVPVIPMQPILEPELPVIEQPVVPPPVVTPPPVVVPPPVVAPPPVIPPEMPPVEEVVPIPETVVVVQPPVMEHTHVIESKVEVEIVMPKCPPMAPIEEPCEMEKDILEGEDICQYYCEEEEEEKEEEEEEHKHYHQKQAVSPYYNEGMHSKIKKVIRRLRKYEPFEEERDYSWFKVGEDIYDINSASIPYMGYMVPMGYPFMTEGCSMMMDRKDYILGVKYEDRDEDEDDRRKIKYLLFGVPAIYSKRNEQYYKSRGFMEYRKHKSKDYGYFIMCLDLRNGMLCHID